MSQSEPKSLWTRRRFLATSVVAGATVQAFDLSLFSEGTTAGPSGAGNASDSRESGAAGVSDWFDRPMRFANLTFVEEDPGRCDPKRWLDYFARIHADAATLSAGGYMAYYPTRIPLHHRSVHLGDQDLFGTMYHGCRRQGMQVIARIDPHACRQEVAEAHPDWISTDAAGKPRRHLAMDSLWITCALGPYNFEFMRDVIREIVTLYPVDAVFSNRWNGIGRCHCPHCRANFRKATGMEIPLTEDSKEPAQEAFLAWQQERLFALWRLWDDTVRAANPRARFIPNMGGGIWQFLDLREVGRRADILFADRQGRTAGATGGVGLTAPWAIGRAGKEFRAVMGSKPVAAGYSVGVEEPYRWKDSVQSEAEQRVWMADGIAHGLRLSFGKTGATVYDDRWMDFTAELFGWHHRNERYLRNEESLAQVAMVYAQRSATVYGRQKEGSADPTQRHYHNFIDYPYRNEDHSSGLYQAMIEARIPFDMVCDRMLDPEHIDRYKLLLLPNISVLSDLQCEQLRAYVARGGSLLATYETSLYDEKGRRKDFGLRELFGASFRGWRPGPTLNSYLNIHRKARFGEALAAGLGRAERVVGGVWYLDVETIQDPLTSVDARQQQAADAAPLTLIPPYPHLPMEELYPRTRYTNIPQVLMREVGKGRVVYFPWDIDRLFWEALLEDHGILLGNAARWALAGAAEVTVEGPGIVDVAAWRQKGSMTVHLVNLTNPYMMKGPFRELLPLGAQKVRIPLSFLSGAPQAVRLLVSGAVFEPRIVDGAVEVVVPSITDREVVAVDLHP